MRATIADKIQAEISANLGTDFTYYYGDPILIPEANLPAVIVETQRTVTQAAPTGMERLQHTIMVKICYNKKDDFGLSPTEIPAQRKLEEIAEGIDESTGEYSTQSIAGVLRRNYTLVNSINHQELDINYGVMPRPKGGAVLTAEAQITATVQEDLPITGRA